MSGRTAPGASADSLPANRPFMTTELGLRVASAVVMLIGVLFAAWLGGTVFTLFCIALACALFYEWERMTSLTPFDGVEALLVTGFAIMMLGALVGGFWWALTAFLALGLVLESLSSGAERREVRWIGLGALYAAIPAVFLPLILERGGFWLLIFIFLVVWAADIGGYFAGRRFGGAKLWPAVSPKKTWSGAIGATAASGVIGGIYGAVTDVGLVLCVGAAVLLSVVSQAGDLFESAVKRQFDIKDSSGLIPGHGGVLDRVDGLIAVALVAGLVVLL